MKTVPVKTTSIKKSIAGSPAESIFISNPFERMNGYKTVTVGPQGRKELSSRKGMHCVMNGGEAGIRTLGEI
ncbi:MAG: hypothetical protein U0411_05615 [Thermodesulfovibrionales bacterium]